MKKLALIAMLLVFSLISGCTSKQANTTAADTVPYSKADMKLGYDGQSFFYDNNREFTETDDGYYYFDNSLNINKGNAGRRALYLMFFDKETNKSVPVCNLADCMHKQESESCNAQFAASYGGEQKTSMPYFLWYYNGSLYTIMINSNTNTYNYDLYQISLDGSKRTKYIELYTLYEEDGISIPEAFFHRGYIYYTITEKDGIECLFKVKIEKDAEPEQIVKLDNEDAFISRYQIYRTGITYAECQYDTEAGYVDVIKYYDSNTGKITDILDNNINITSYAIAEDKLYYSSADTVYVYNINSGETEEMCAVGRYMRLSYDGEYIYVEYMSDESKDYSEHSVYIFDLEGNQTDVIQLLSSQYCYFGDSDYLFQMFDLNGKSSGENSTPMIKAFDKDQIGTGCYEWIELPITE